MLLDQEFNRLQTKLLENQVFIRYGDGEVMLSHGIPVGPGTQAFQVDRWCSPAGVTNLGTELKDLLNNPEWYYGIPCQCCNVNCKNLILNLLKDVPSDKITFANLFINGNYPEFKNWITKISKPVVVLANKHGTYKYPFKVEEVLRLPDDCVNYWQNNKAELVELSTILAKKYSNAVFLFSGGPLKVLLKYMWEANHNNSYLDIGSALDPWTYGGFLTRPYQAGQGEYASRNCLF